MSLKIRTEAHARKMKVISVGGTTFMGNILQSGVGLTNLIAIMQVQPQRHLTLGPVAVPSICTLEAHRQKKPIPENLEKGL